MTVAQENGRLNRVREVMLAMQRDAWEQGVCAQALFACGEEALGLLLAHDAVVRQAEDGRLGLVGDNRAVCDPAACGIPVLEAFARTGLDSYRRAADKMANWLLTCSHRTSDGTLYHFVEGQEVWIDSIFMAPPFLAAAGYPEQAVAQIEGFRQLLWSREESLYSHRWSDRTRTFARRDFWASGNGWAAAGIVQVAGYLPESMDPQRQTLCGYLVELFDGMLSHLRPDGLFHDVLDDGGSFVETNAAQMLAFALYEAARLGRTSDRYLDTAERMRDAACALVDAEGFVRGACGSPTFDRPGVSAEAQAFHLLMEGARSRLRRS
ncbi:glycoside hydrolase family 88 protein [Salinispira pacifica]